VGNPQRRLQAGNERWKTSNRGFGEIAKIAEDGSLALNIGLQLEPRPKLLEYREFRWPRYRSALQEPDRSGELFPGFIPRLRRPLAINFDHHEPAFVNGLEDV